MRRETAPERAVSRAPPAASASTCPSRVIPCAQRLCAGWGRKKMCGFIGMIGRDEPVVSALYDGLIALQHRGQDAAGMATFDGRFHLKKGEGLVRDVFRQKNMDRLK